MCLSDLRWREVQCKSPIHLWHNLQYHAVAAIRNWRPGGVEILMIRVQFWARTNLWWELSSRARLQSRLLAFPDYGRAMRPLSSLFPAVKNCSHLVIHDMLSKLTAIADLCSREWRWCKYSFALSGNMLHTRHQYSSGSKNLRFNFGLFDSELSNSSLELELSICEVFLRSWEKCQFGEYLLEPMCSTLITLLLLRLGLFFFFFFFSLLRTESNFSTISLILSSFFLTSSCWFTFAISFILHHHPNDAHLQLHVLLQNLRTVPDIVLHQVLLLILENFKFPFQKFELLDVLFFLAH